MKIPYIDLGMEYVLIKHKDLTKGDMFFTKLRGELEDHIKELEKELDIVKLNMIELEEENEHLLRIVHNIEGGTVK